MVIYCYMQTNTLKQIYSRSSKPLEERNFMPVNIQNPGIQLGTSQIKETSKSHRILATPSSYAKEHYLYVQEVGTLQSLEAHISTRQNLSSYLFFMVLSGEGSIVYQGQKRNLREGDCVWIDCHTLYSHESSDTNPWELKWIHFYGTNAWVFYQQFLELGYSYVFRPVNKEGFVHALDEIYSLWENPLLHTELLTHKYITDIISLCYTESNSSDVLTHSSGKEGTKHKLQLIREYIDAHYRDDLSLDELSNLFFISKYHLSREFRKEFGVTIGHAITSKKVSKAKSLLRFSKDSIEQIGETCGFQDSGYFIKVFKRAENMTPLEYRKKW